MSKSYDRGVYALKDGGLWRAHSSTQGERGWECVVNGIKSLDVEQIDDRTVRVTAALSNGGSDVKEFKFPTLIDKGPHKTGERYEKGDGVTYGGSYWIAQKETKSKPGTDADWRMAVKKGRDAVESYQAAKEKGFKGSEEDWLRQKLNRISGNTQVKINKAP